MTRLHVTPEMMHETYRLLCTTPPFNRWHLPPAGDVVFRVWASRRSYGEHLSDRQRKTHPSPGRHIVTVSYRLVGQLPTLLQVMAHEMCHIRESMLAGYTGTAHGARFNRLADAVCRHHNFDRRAF